MDDVILRLNSELQSLQSAFVTAETAMAAAPTEQTHALQAVQGEGEEIRQLMTWPVGATTVQTVGRAPRDQKV